MLTSPTSRTAYLLLMLAAMALLAALAVIVLRQGIAAGTGEAAMLAWVLGFVIALPLALLLLPALAAWHRGHATVIPLAGEKVP